MIERGGNTEGTTAAFNLATTVQTALQSVSSSVTDVLAIVIPAALAIAGVIWVARKAFKWFKGMGNG